METLLIKAMRRAKYIVAGKAKPEQYQHYALNLPLYTHFTNPSRRYADVVVHRQLDVALSKGLIEFTEDIDSLSKTAESCNNKKDSAQSAQEQSVHIDSCRIMDKKKTELGSDFISEGIVLCVYESAFDILIPDYGFEKRVHCDQLPLKKAEFRKDERVLELYWEKGVPSSAYVPEDERPSAKASQRHQDNTLSHVSRTPISNVNAEARQYKQVEAGTVPPDDADALFDEDDNISEITESTAGVSLGVPGSDRPTQSMPPSPIHEAASADEAPLRTHSDPKLSTNISDTAEAKLSNKEKYLSLFKLREEGGEHIQDVTEMTRVPVVLKTDLTKSPPCLTIRSMNPYAL